MFAVLFTAAYHLARRLKKLGESPNYPLRVQMRISQLRSQAKIRLRLAGDRALARLEDLTVLPIRLHRAEESLQRCLEERGRVESQLLWQVDLFHLQTENSMTADEREDLCRREEWLQQRLDSLNARIKKLALHCWELREDLRALEEHHPHLEKILEELEFLEKIFKLMKAAPAPVPPKKKPALERATRDLTELA